MYKKKLNICTYTSISFAAIYSLILVVEYGNVGIAVTAGLLFGLITMLGNLFFLSKLNNCLVGNPFFYLNDSIKADLNQIKCSKIKLS